MSKEKKKDTLLSSIERVLAPGHFIAYGASWTFIEGLERIKSQLDNLVTKGGAVRAVKLYELFIAGCCEKMEEIDDSIGNMGMFFESLFCSWVVARQSAHLDSGETINQILKMMDNDEYGLCYKIENRLSAILGEKEIDRFEEKIRRRFKECFSKESKDVKTIYDFSSDVRNNADILKAIYAARKKSEEYISLCEKIGITPKDCEAIAHIYRAEKRYEQALYFAGKGLDLEKEGGWPNHSGFELSDLKRELLSVLGRRGEALQTAWQEFVQSPSEYSYEELLKYVPKKDKESWRSKAVAVAQKESLDSGIIGLLIKIKEFNILSERIFSAAHNELECLGYYALKEAAKELSKNHYAAAAKIYRAMGMEIVNNGRSKHYKYALYNFENTKKLYGKANIEKEWLSMVEIMRKKHSLKYSFMKDFEDIVSGKSLEKEPSFLEVASERWRKQIS